MREAIRKFAQTEIVTLSQLSEMFDEKVTLIYRYVVTQRLCDYATIGKSHVIIDIVDVPKVRERVAKAKALRSYKDL